MVTVMGTISRGKNKTIGHRGTLENMKLSWERSTEIWPLSWGQRHGAKDKIVMETFWKNEIPTGTFNGDMIIVAGTFWKK